MRKWGGKNKKGGVEKNEESHRVEELGRGEEKNEEGGRRRIRKGSGEK